MGDGQVSTTALSSASYYEPESRLQLVDKVRHLIRFSDFLLLLTGESGVGKTTLLKQISPSTADNSVHACLISVVDGLPLGTMLSGLLAQLPSHSSFIDTDQGKLEALNEQIKVTRDHGQRLLIMVDDADRLSDEALDLLINLQLAHDNNDGTAPQLLLLGQPELAGRLERSRWLDALAGRYHQLSLEPFAEDEMKEFILQAVPGVRMMSEKEVRTMAKRSGGYPGHLNGDVPKKVKKKSKPKKVQDTPNELPPADKTESSSRRAFPLPPIHMAGIALLLIVITVAAAWTFAPEDEPSVTVDEGSNRVKVPLNLSIPGQSGEPAVSELDKRLAVQEARLKQPDVAIKPLSPEPSTQPLPEPLPTHEIAEDVVNTEVKRTPAPEVVEPEPPKVVLELQEPVEPTVTTVAKKVPANPPQVTVPSQPKVVRESAIGSPEPAEVAPTADEPKRLSPVVVTTEAVAPKTTPTVAGTEDNPAPNVSPASEPKVTPSPKPEVVDVSTRAPTQNTSPKVVERSEPVQKAVVSVQAKADTKAEVVLKEDKVPRSARILDDEKVLLSEPSGNYTLQLLGAREKSSTERFLKAYPNSQDFRVFATLFKGKPWYVVVYGSYATRQQAIAAVATLPDALKKQRPWARSMKGVHNDIQKR